MDMFKCYIFNICTLIGVIHGHNFTDSVGFANLIVFKNTTLVQRCYNVVTTLSQLSQRCHNVVRYCRHNIMLRSVDHNVNTSTTLQ